MARAGRARRPVALAALLALALAGAGDGAAGGERDCFERAMVTVYLHHVQDRVMDRWGIPPDTLGDQQVVAALWLGADGALLHHELVSWTSHRLAETVAHALRGAGPFGPVPEEAACLVGKKIVIKFVNAY